MRGSDGDGGVVAKQKVSQVSELRDDLHHPHRKPPSS